MDLSIGTWDSTEACSRWSYVPQCNIFLFRDNEAGKSFRESNGTVYRDDLLVLQKVIKTKKSV